MFDNAKLHIYMKRIAETELILTPKKKIYHLNLSKDEIGENILLVGDPGRVKIISNKFDKIECQIQNREFVTHTGIFKGKRISAISTGIGTDNVDIVVNELDALVNINFDTRTVNPIKKSLNIFRVGTSGAIQDDIKVDTFLASAYGLGFDNLAHFYSDNKIIEKKMSEAYALQTEWPKDLSAPYIIKASEKLLSLFNDIPNGITATASGFYGPQGRTLRLKPSISKFHEKMTNFKFDNNQIKNFEMETSALYYLGRTLGHNTLTICAIIGNRINKEYSKDHRKTIEQLINLTLQRICQ
tara:strand:+ start:471 stop:1367 length:897 start_codon:yes stop_codon:yes gene_type:complete